MRRLSRSRTGPHALERRDAAAVRRNVVAPDREDRVEVVVRALAAVLERNPECSELLMHVADADEQASREYVEGRELLRKLLPPPQSPPT